jgi:hypothetical protein
MIIDTVQIASTVVTLTAPFMPYLLEPSKVVGQKWIEVIAEKGGEAAWNKAQTLWGKVFSHFGNDAKVKGSALFVSADPDDETSQTLLVKALAVRFQEDPQFAQELLQIVGGPQAVQEVLAERRSWVEDVTQEINGSGVQRVKASDDSSIKGVRQIKQ